MDKLNGMKIKGIRQSMAEKLIMEDEKCQNMPGYREALLPSTYPLGVKYYIRECWNITVTYSTLLGNEVQLTKISRMNRF